MSEVLETGEMARDGYEYPIVCPLNICAGSPVSKTVRNGRWECDECGKVILQWVRDDPKEAQS